jgi:hypothetical protein
MSRMQDEEKEPPWWEIHLGCLSKAMWVDLRVVTINRPMNKSVYTTKGGFTCNSVGDLHSAWMVVMVKHSRMKAAVTLRSMFDDQL